jgi:glycogen operon protein
MFLMGDEVARTQNGNNNTYCQDNTLNWFDWSLIERNAEIFRFAKTMIAFRKAHPVLRHGYHLSFRDYKTAGLADMMWFSTEALSGDGRDKRLTLAFLLSGAHAKGGLATDSDVFVAMNMHWEDQVFDLPVMPNGRRWRVAVNTGVDAPHDIHEPGQEPLLRNTKHLPVRSRAVVILVSR